MLKSILLLLFVSFGTINIACATRPVLIQEPIHCTNMVDASLVVDVNTKRILHHNNVNAKIYPASLTKMMTIYVALQEVKRGKISLDSKLKVSQNASNIEASKIGLKEGATISLRDAISAMIVISANDAALVVAENIAGSENQFAKIMTARAHQLGMKDTIFKNSSGLPNKNQLTTAIDVAKLAIALERDFKEYYYLFGQTSFSYLGRKYQTINKLTAKYKSINGIKTGYTKASGFNLVTSANKNGKKLVGVVIGSRDSLSRNHKMVTLISKYLNVKSTISRNNNRSRT